MRGLRLTSEKSVFASKILLAAQRLTDGSLQRLDMPMQRVLF
jgi:hypothetical protein